MHKTQNAKIHPLMWSIEVYLYNNDDNKNNTSFWLADLTINKIHNSKFKRNRKPFSFVTY